MIFSLETAKRNEWFAGSGVGQKGILLLTGLSRKNIQEQGPRPVRVAMFCVVTVRYLNCGTGRKRIVSRGPLHPNEN